MVQIMVDNLLTDVETVLNTQVERIVLIQNFKF